MANILKCSNFESNKLTFSNIYSGQYQYVSLPSYNFGTLENPKMDKFIFETDWITNNITFAVNNEAFDPGATPKVLTVGLDPNQDSCVKLKTLLEGVNAQVDIGKNVFVNQIGGPKINKYHEYSKTKIVKPHLDFDTEELSDNPNFFPLENLKFLKQYETEEILTKFKFQACNSNTLKPCDPMNTFDDLKNIIKKGCQFRLIVIMEKVWFQKNGSYNWGSKFSILRMDIKEQVGNKTIPQLVDLVEFHDEQALIEYSDGDETVIEDYLDDEDSLVETDDSSEISYNKYKKKKKLKKKKQYSPGTICI